MTTEATLTSASVPAPDAPADRYPSSWRGVRQPARAALERWGAVELTMMAFNVAMLAWLMVTILTFGDRTSQDGPLAALGFVFGSWAAGSVALFLGLSAWGRASARRDGR